jgi:hypothetical protein
VIRLTQPATPWLFGLLQRRNTDAYQITSDAVYLTLKLPAMASSVPRSRSALFHRETCPDAVCSSTMAAMPTSVRSVFSGKPYHSNYCWCRMAPIPVGHEFQSPTWAGLPQGRYLPRFIRPTSFGGTAKRAILPGLGRQDRRCRHCANWSTPTPASAADVQPQAGVCNAPLANRRAFRRTPMPMASRSIYRPTADRG